MKIALTDWCFYFTYKKHKGKEQSVLRAEMEHQFQMVWDDSRIMGDSCNHNEGWGVDALGTQHWFWPAMGTVELLELLHRLSIKWLMHPVMMLLRRKVSTIYFGARLIMYSNTLSSQWLTTSIVFPVQFALLVVHTTSLYEVAPGSTALWFQLVWWWGQNCAGYSALALGFD